MIQFNLVKYYPDFNLGNFKTNKGFGFLRFNFFIKKVLDDNLDGYFNSLISDYIIDCKFNIDSNNNIEKIWDVKKIYKNDNFNNFMNYSIVNDKILNENFILVQNIEEGEKNLLIINLDSNKIIYKISSKDINKKYYNKFLKNTGGHDGYHFDNKPTYICNNNERYLYFRYNYESGLRKCGCMMSENNSFNFTNFNLVEFVDCKFQYCYELIPFTYNNEIYAIGYNYLSGNNVNLVNFDEEAIILFKQINYCKFKQIKIIDSKKNSRYNYYIVGYDINQTKKHWLIMNNKKMILYKII